MVFRAFLRWIHYLWRLDYDHVSYLEKSAMGALLADYAKNTLPHDMKILPTRPSFVSAVRKMVLGADISN
jgi:hypothetical protein